MLVTLLVVIAVLLGVLVALLPRGVPQESGGVADTAPSAVAAGPSESRSDADAPRVDQTSHSATEVYPDNEAPQHVRVPSTASESEAGTGTERPWWLPADPVPPSERGGLALVLDDAGNSIAGLDAFLSLPMPLAVAVLPQLDYSVESAAMISAAGKEIMLHQPMEALGGANPGPGAIGSELSDEQIESTLVEDLASVPGVIGVNNHMGSRATSDERVMRVVLSTLNHRDLFFLDSRTSAETVGRSVAAAIGIPFAERNVFLDNERTSDAILSSLSHALDLAQDGAPVIMIGHVTAPVLADVLHEAYPILVEAGYRFVPISSLVRPVQVAAEKSAGVAGGGLP